MKLTKITSCKHGYYKEAFNIYKTDIKKNWNVIRNLKSDIADKLNEFFGRVAI